MSGLNPFRPKKSEDPLSHQHHPHTPPSISLPSIAPDPIFFGHSSTTTVATDQTNLPSPNASASATPPPTVTAPDLDDSATSDDQSTSDPFSQDADVSDDEVEQAQTTSEAPTTASPGVLRRPQETIRTTPHFRSSNQPSATTDPSRDQDLKVDTQPHTENSGGQREVTAIPSSFASRQSSASLGETDSDSTADEPLPYARPKISVRPVSLGPGIDPRALATRSGNRDRVPPPPPKSHHGKSISPDLSRVSPVSQTTPGKAASRVSFHGPSPVPSPALSVYPRIQTDPEYFGIPLGQSAVPTDALRRSQSQNKRPPPPPLSRRHSQMGRSKSTLSKPSSSQLSTPDSIVEATASTPATPATPGSRSLTPSLRSRNSRNSLYIPDEASSNSTLRSENTTPPSLQPTELSGLGIQPNPRTTSKRASLINNLPPPPPPRRTRGSNHSNDSNRPASIRSEQRVDGPAKFTSNPSNASDILADLSRLQKEVDDLRGHYENRRSQ